MRDDGQAITTPRTRVAELEIVYIRLLSVGTYRRGRFKDARSGTIGA
jgi:hypothetical protein